MSYSSFSRDGRKADFGWSIWQCLGQCVIFTVPLVHYFCHDLLTMSLEFNNQLCCMGNTSSRFCVLSMLYTGIAFCKGIRGTLCFLAHALLIKIAFPPEFRSASSFVRSFQLLAGMIWIDRHISCVGLMLCMNASSGISSFIIFFWFLLEKLSPGLMSLVSPLGDPSNGKVEFEIIVLSVKSLLSLISSTGRTLYLLWPSAHPDWCLRPRLFLTL